MVFNSFILIFFVIVRVVSLSVLYWGNFYIGSSYLLTLFFITLTLFVFSMLLLSLRGSFLIIFLGWEGLGVTSFVLIIFYQNWISAKGSVLTLLTNRLGDSVLLISFCYLLVSLQRFTQSSFYFRRLLVLVAITKSAQWPFIRWLPAAMAAPTPVRALVHSSTLVTAGVWLIARYSVTLRRNSILWLILGLLTLTVASLAARQEVDAKKVVALSTLRQLGLMFVALATGRTLICLFHVLMHALAKANLFIVIGRLLHRGFSQQDSRALSTTALDANINLGALISIFSLTGLLFTSGFFSKEQILFSQYTILRRLVSWFLILLLRSLTVMYCLKLLYSLISRNQQRLLFSSYERQIKVLPIFILRSGRLFVGWRFIFNLCPISILTNSLEFIYFSVWVFGGLLAVAKLRILSKRFLLQEKFIDFFLRKIESLKQSFKTFERPFSENLMLVTSLQHTLIFKQSLRLSVLLSRVVLIVLIL